MKNESQSVGTPEEEAEGPVSDEAPQAEVPQGRSGEGAGSAMKHWLHEERNRVKRPEP